MGHEQAFALSAAGMSLERTRVEIAAANLAHANVALGPGSSYAPQRVLARPASFAGLVAGGLSAGLPEVEVASTDEPRRRVQDPGHPWADADGFVAYPGVDPAAEMFALMAASRSYEANLVALQTARQMALRALDIGRGS